MTFRRTVLMQLKQQISEPRITRNIFSGQVSCLWCISWLNIFWQSRLRMVRLGTQNGRKLERKHLTTAILCGLLVGSHAEPVRILCLGDSITQGGKNDRAEYTYRWPLFCMLVDAEVDFDFIGSLDTGLNKDAKWPETYKGKPFDLDHEGIYGIKTRDALNRLPEASKQWDGIPDIALIHLGSNDKGEDNPVDDVKEPLRKIIEFLREQNPDIVILLGHLLSNDDPNAFRVMAVVSELRKEMDTEKSPVRVVQHYRNWHENPGLPNTDTFDWAHPNPQGQKKMADCWFEAMQPWLK